MQQVSPIKPSWWPYAAALGAFLAATSFFFLAETRPPPTTGENWNGLLCYIFSFMGLPLGLVTFAFGAVIGQSSSADRVCVALSAGWVFGLAVSLLPSLIAGRAGAGMGTVMFFAFLCGPIFSLLALYWISPPPEAGQEAE